MSERPKQKSRTVLIVDDDPMILHVVEELISSCGYQSIVASSGEEALRTAEKQEKIHLLVTDIMMPEMNGIDLSRQFLSIYPETQILFISGYFCPTMDHYGIPDSKYDFLRKPFDIETLISKIKILLNDPAAKPMAQFDS